MEVEDEQFERPGSAGSIAKMLEQVKYDTTPRAEKERYFDSPQQEENDLSSIPYSPELSKARRAMNLRQFILDSEPTTPDSDVDDRMKQLTLNTTNPDPGTPTQKLFFPP